MTKITIDRAVVEQALETLGALSVHGDLACVVTPQGEFFLRPAIAILESALAEQQQQEPPITAEASLRFKLDCTKDQLEAAERENAELRARLRAAAPEAQPSQPHKLPIPPAPIDPLEVVFVEGWNACCDEFFGGKPSIDPVIITVEAQPRKPLTDEEIDAAYREHEQTYSLVSSAWSFEAGVRFAEAENGIAPEAQPRQPLTDGIDLTGLQHCMIAVRDWMGDGCDTHDTPRPQIAALIAFAAHGITGGKT